MRQQLRAGTDENVDSPVRLHRLAASRHFKLAPILHPETSLPPAWPRNSWRFLAAPHHDMALEWLPTK